MASKKTKMEEDEESLTYCDTCNLECKTELRLEKHVQSMMHILAAQAKKTTSEEKPTNEKKENKKEEEEEEEEDSDDEDEVVETFCKVCNIECKTETGFYNHTSGMAHIMRAQKMGDVDKPAADSTEWKKVAAEQKRIELSCTICDCLFSNEENQQQHMESKQHRKRAYIHRMGGLRGFTDGLRTTKLGEPPECMGALMDAPKPLVGLDYMVEIRRVNPQNPPYYACMLCQDPVPELINHIRNKEHRKRFLKAHLPEHEEEFKDLCPGKDHEHYRWFRLHFFKELVDADAERPRDPKTSFIVSMLNSLCEAFYSAYGMQQMQVVQESVGQRPRRYYRNSDQISLRPPTPTRRDPGAIQAKSCQIWQAKRVYVGNIPEGITGDILKDFFNKQLAELDLGNGEGISNVQVYPDKKFAFLSFRQLEEASACLELDGISFQGMYLKLRRPNQYKQELFGSKDKPPAENADADAGKPIQGRGSQQQGNQLGKRTFQDNFGSGGEKKMSRVEQQQDSGYGYYDDYTADGGYEDYSAYGGPAIGMGRGRGGGYGHDNQYGGENANYGQGDYYGNKNTYGGVGGRYGGNDYEANKNSRPMDRNPRGQAPGNRGPSMGQQRPPSAQPAQPAVMSQSPPPPPPPPANFMSECLNKACNVLQQNSISSDGERRMAIQVTNLLTQKISNYKSGGEKGTMPKLKMPEKTGLLDWLRFLVKLLDKGFLNNDGEMKAGQQLLDTLTARMAVYQSDTSTTGPSASTTNSVSGNYGSGMVGSYNTMSGYSAAGYSAGTYGGAYGTGAYGYGATTAQNYTMGTATPYSYSYY